MKALVSILRNKTLSDAAREVRNSLQSISCVGKGVNYVANCDTDVFSYGCRTNRSSGSCGQSMSDQPAATRTSLTFSKAKLGVELSLFAAVHCRVYIRRPHQIKKSHNVFRKRSVRPAPTPAGSISPLHPERVIPPGWNPGVDSPFNASLNTTTLATSWWPWPKISSNTTRQHVWVSTLLACKNITKPC